MLAVQSAVELANLVVQAHNYFHAIALLAH